MSSESPPAPTRCPSCDEPIRGLPAFVHPAVPVLLNVLAASESEARGAPTGRLELVECQRCGMVFNRAFQGVPYDQQYFVDPTKSPRYLQHLDDVCDRLAARMTGRSSFSVVDVGAGQGTFLRHLVARLGPRISRAHGFDPAFRAGETELPDNIGFTASLLDSRAAAAVGFEVQVVVTRQVLEHVLDPVRFLSSFRNHFRDPFLLCVETPDAGHSLERGLLHDFCYEHCAMATDAALAEALRRSGYRDVRVERAFGGEYLLAFASAGGDAAVDRRATPVVMDRTTTGRLSDLAERFVREHEARLRRARTRGRVAIWGGAGKGALFAHLVDPDRALVDLVVDIHPGKQGFFLPGAGHRVVAPEEARHAEVRTIFVANPTYIDEVESLCNANGLAVDLECVGDEPLARRTSGRT